MKIYWYGWRSTFDMSWGWWPSVRWFVLGPVVLNFNKDA